MSSTTIPLEEGSSEEEEEGEDPGVPGSVTAGETVTESVQGSAVFTETSVKLPDISTAPLTAQEQVLSEPGEATTVVGEGTTLPPPPGDVTVCSESPNLPHPSSILPDIFSSSITDMLPDSQSDIASPHVWQRLYKSR